MIKNTFVYSKLKVEGIHSWSGCDVPTVKYLRHPHRHIFHIIVTYQVTHCDRDIEFIDERYNIMNFLKGQFDFNNTTSVFDFGNSSCEHIAKCIYNNYEKSDLITQIEVNEDDENGAILRRE